jgi:Cd2+/Zn2+-exporting ATPase
MIKMSKYKYNINNLDCANCAREIEDALNKNEKFKNVVVNFSASKISYETDEEVSLNELNKLIKKIEPEASVSNDDVSVKKEYHLSLLISGIIAGVLAYFLPVNDGIKTCLYLLSYILLLYRTTFNAIKLLIKSRIINENALITISCLGAFVIDKKMEGFMVIVLYTIGKILEEKALNNSRKSIKDLLDIKQSYANLLRNNKTYKIDVEKIEIGDILVVKKGEKIPVDGVVISDNAILDTSALTGESELVKVKKDDEVLSGSINVGEVIKIKATSLFENSTVFKILELLNDASDKKSKTETLVSKISKIYTPIILVLAVCTVILLPIVADISYKESLYRGLTFLVIACPCAIAISIPLSYFTGIGVASKKGILIKGSNYFDNLSSVQNIIFDKTGTLTNGSFTVENIEIFGDYSKDEVINILMKGESFSNHPIANSIMKLKDEKIDNSDCLDFKEIEGKGISFTLNNKKILIGNKELCKCDFDATLHLNIDGKHIASIIINDGIKDNAKETVNELKKYGIKTFMFTGDKKEVALDIGKKLGIDEIKYEMLPTDKFSNFEKVSDAGITMFVGDGINDAPVLKRADIGVSMGGVGSASAIEASDVVLMKDDLSKIVKAIDISSYTKAIIKQNLLFAILVKVVILILSVFGLANMWFAVFADTGVTLLTILNTLRIINKFKNK